MQQVTVSKTHLYGLLGERPQTAVQLHAEYMKLFEPFVAVDQIEAALVELSLLYPDLKQAESGSATGERDAVNMVQSAVPVKVYWRE